MINNENIDGSTYINIGGDFANVFDSNDYIALVNSTDTSGVILRAHLILEEFLNIWCSKVTNTDDLFKGSFIGFKSKLDISHNLGLSKEFYDVLITYNLIRNRYSHRRQYVLEASSLDKFRLSVDSLDQNDRLLPCDEFCIYIEGVDTSTNERVKKEYSYKDADLNKKIIIIFCILVMKLITSLQSEFDARGIQYTLVSDIPPLPESH